MIRLLKYINLILMVVACYFTYQFYNKHELCSAKGISVAVLLFISAVIFAYTFVEHLKHRDNRKNLIASTLGFIFELILNCILGGL